MKLIKYNSYWPPTFDIASDGSNHPLLKHILLGDPLVQCVEICLDIKYSVVFCLKVFR